MRTRHIIMSGNTIEKDTRYTFTGRRSERGNPMKIAVSFPPEWDRAVKVMAFYDYNRKECEPQIIRNGECEVPAECLKEITFYVQVLCKKDGVITETNILPLLQIGG